MIRSVIYRGAIGLLALLVVLLCIFLTAFNPKLPLMYKIADGYKGWAIVRYEDPSCAPIQRENIFFVISVPSSGVGCTSSALKPGWRISFYEYVSGAKVIRRLPQSVWGGNGEIWAAFGIPDKHSESFFVGTEQELQKSWSSRPK
jgi:hypothetical protein